MSRLHLPPEIEKLLVGFNQKPAMHQTPIHELRKTRSRIDADGVVPVKSTQDIHIKASSHVIPARTYHPFDSTEKPSLLVFYHGGGFVFGGLEGYYDHVCRVLCDLSNSIVVSVDYRLAPEHKFPAAADDAWSALHWCREHCAQLGADERSIFIAGGSAGANLAAVTALRVRDEDQFNVQGQVLFYPMTNFPEPPTDSFHEFNAGYYLTGKDILWFWEQYLEQPSDRLNPYAAPLRAKDLKNVAPAFVLTAEADPLRDEAEAYAQRLQDAGVPVKVTRYKGMLHGFLAFPTPRSQEALLEASDWIRGIKACLVH
jgi:acetyl esterase